MKYNRIITKNGRVQYRDERGRVVKQKIGAREFIRENKNDISGEGLTEIEQKELNRQNKLDSRIRDKSGRFISNIARDFLKQQAEDLGVDIKELLKNPEAVEIATSSIIDLEYFSRVIFERIGEHKGKVQIDGVTMSKTAAKEFFMNKVNEDFEFIKNKEKVPPIDIVYTATLNQKTGVLNIESDFKRYVVSKPKKGKRNGSKKTKGVSKNRK